MVETPYTIGFLKRVGQCGKPGGLLVIGRCIVSIEGQYLLCKLDSVYFLRIKKTMYLVLNAKPDKHVVKLPCQYYTSVRLRNFDNVK
jgi:hypothetical protein